MPQLDLLIESAREYRKEHGFTAEEQEMQVRSFAYGNTRLANDRTTMDDIDAAVRGVSRISDFLRNSLSLQDLEDYSAELSWNIHKRGGDEAQALAYQVRAILNAHTEDSDESALRQELADAIAPFSQTRESAKAQ